MRSENEMKQPLESDWNALSPLEKAHSHAASAAEAQKAGQDQAAFAYCVQALNLYRGLDDHANVVRMLLRLSYLAGWADFQDGLDMFTRRRKLAEEVFPLAREIGDPKLLAEALCTFAGSVSSSNSMEMLEESRDLAVASGDKALLAKVLSRMGNQLGLQGDRKPGLSLQEQALALFREIDDRAGIAHLLFSLSIWAEGAQKKAYLEEALELQRQLGAKRRIYEILTMLDSNCDPSDLDRREAYNLEALALARELGSAVWQASCLDRLAEFAATRGDTDRSNALRTESKSIYQEPEMDPDLLEAFGAALESGDVQKMEEALTNMTQKTDASETEN